ncbi:methyltransferase domain-containing protein [Nocardioides houyundeii]|uniref:methyltransferase domain-containing protein n=1 Tax=Nocardioides houyundeii TaxID=2045452 RepID=UPI0013158FF9|nr:methyltransferase domain-containing protein [Nocardioides houyundeii]
MSGHRYDNEVADDNVYGHALSLLAEHLADDAAGGVHLDLACGFGHIAEHVSKRFDLHYVGVDLDPQALAAVTERGLEAHAVDLGSPEAAEELLRVLDGRRLASLTFLDGLEHLTSPVHVLTAMSRLMSAERAVGVISVPNVTHLDVATKALLGQWEYTESGLLDATHYQLFSARSLEVALRRAGLARLDSRDVVLARSDQHLPSDHVGLSERTSLGQWLRAVRSDAEGHGSTNQFVWALGAVPAQAATPAAREPSEVFLSVVMRTQGRRSQELREALLCLAAQSCDDFEVILVAHRTTVSEQLAVERIVEDQPPHLRSRLRLLLLDEGGRSAPINLGLRHAHGRYVAVFDDDDLVLAHWVEAFRTAEQDSPGRILRGVALRQRATLSQVRGAAGVKALDAPEAIFDREFSLAHHLVANQTPLFAFAFPRSLHVDLGLEFDDSLSTTEDWQFLLRAAQLSGVTDVGRTVAVYQWWPLGESSRTLHSSEEWSQNRAAIDRLIDSRPLLLPAGETRRLREDLGRLRRAEQIVDEQGDAILEVHHRHEKVQDQLRAELRDALTLVHELNLVVASQTRQLTKAKRRLERQRAKTAQALAQTGQPGKADQPSPGQPTTEPAGPRG